jgi:hypothetical protein
MPVAYIDNAVWASRFDWRWVEKRAAAYARRRVERKNGRFWSAQFSTEVAPQEGFEPATPSLRSAESGRFTGFDSGRRQGAARGASSVPSATLFYRTLLSELESLHLSSVAWQRCDLLHAMTVPGGA